MPSPIRLTIAVAPDGSVPTALENLAHQIANSLNSAGAAGNAGLGQAASHVQGLNGLFAGLMATIKTSNNALTTLAAGLYDVQRIGGLLKNVLVDPFVNFGSRVIEATEIYRKFQVAISSTSGGFNRAGDITQALIGASRTSPQTSVDLLANLRGLIGAPGVSQLFANGSPQQSASQLASISDLVSRATVFSPTGDLGEVVQGLRALLGGNVQTFRRRLSINPEDLAGTVGSSVKQLQSDPQLALRAFQNYTNIFSDSNQFNQKSGIFSNAELKLEDAFTQAFGQIGKSGVYDQLTDRLRGFTDQLLDSFDPQKNQAFGQQAQRISNSIVDIVDNLFNSISGLVQHVSGNNQPINSLSELVADIFDLVDKGTSMLPEALKLIGDFVHGLVTMANNLYQLAADPAGYVAGAANRDFNKATAASGTNALMSVNDPAYARAAEKINENNPWWAGFVGYAKIPTPADVAKYGNAPDDQKKSPFDFSNLQGGLLSQIASPYAVQRDLQKSLDQQLSGVGVRDIVQGILSPVKDAVGDSDYRSKSAQTLSQAMTLPDRLAKLFNTEVTPGGPGTGGYPALLAAAQADLKATTLFPTQINSAAPFRINDLTQMFSNPRFGTRDNLSALSDAIGPDAAQTYYQKQILNSKGALTDVQKIPATLVTDLQNLAGQLATEMTSLPPSAAIKLGDSLMDNVDGLADAISKALKLPPDATALLQNAMKTAPAELRNLVQTNTFNGQLSALSLGLPTDGSLPPTAKDLLQSLKSRTPNSIDQGTLNLRYGRQAQLSADYNNAQAAGDQTAMQNLAQELAENQKQLDELIQKLSPAQQAFEQFAQSVRDAFQTGIGNVIEDLIRGTGNLRDAVTSMANDIIGAFAKMESQNIVNGLVGPLGQAGQGANGASGGLGGLLGEIFPSIRAATNGPAWTGDASASAAATSGGGFAGFANGGVFSTPFVPVRAFASGGIASQPTFIAGERGLSEAIVPLPDGKHLPVALTGNSGGGDTYIVSNIDEAIRKGYMAHKDVLIDVVSGEISKPGSKFNKAARNV